MSMKCIDNMDNNVKCKIKSNKNIDNVENNVIRRL